MKAMPLLMHGTKPMQGPKVPILGRYSKLRADGLVPEDHVAVYGFKDGVRETLKEIHGAETLETELRVDTIQYIQVELFNHSKGLYLWLE